MYGFATSVLRADSSSPGAHDPGEISTFLQVTRISGGISVYFTAWWLNGIA